MDKQHDLLDEFLDRYDEESQIEALRIIIPHPNIAYETLFSKDRVFFYFVNYADACVFKGALEFKVIFQILESFCLEYPSLKILADRFLEQSRIEYELFTSFISPMEEVKELKLPPAVEQFFILLKQGVLSNQEGIEAILQRLPNQFQKILRPKIAMMRGWEVLQLAKPGLMQELGEGDQWIYKQPWRAFSYALPLERQPQGKIEGWPLIFLEPLEGMDYAAFLEPYCSQECLIVFQTVSHLFQLLQFEALHEILARPHVYFYVLDLYPQGQFLHQNLRWQNEHSLYPVWMLSQMQLKEALPALSESLKASLMQPSEDFERDTPPFNWLYGAAKQALSAIESHRYGKERAIALSIEQGLQKWFDPHKGNLPVNAPLGPLPENYIKEEIEQRLKVRGRPSFFPKNKIRLAHVVPQIVDGGHAPTKLLKTLCTFADRRWFDVYVISTERLADHVLSYPVSHFSSPSSSQRGSLTLKYFNDIGVTALFDGESPTYDLAIKNTLDTLQSLSIDLAIFHGPDELNSLISSSTQVPIRVLFDHGTLPSYPCFDLAILSTDEAYHQNHEAFRQKGMESCILHFSIDVRMGWLDRPFGLPGIGLPDGSFVMTTISHHLDTRVTAEMCHAIGKILKRCPKAVYAPMGEVVKKKQWMAIFEQYGVASRIFFLGECYNPSQFARSMHLYLNEFPFGSGLGILDAMAAGCPVVSMYDEHGPQQARYAATYFGSDYVIKSGLIDDYVDLACRLIENPVMYQEWSEHALSQYEKRVDTPKYVQKFETILEQFIEYFQKNE
ncbi:hypothetical protein PNK_0015 [Candidatus Protochlamydia naegleriophila]|uniref:Glycosyl transferase family 1 domain-containing protein n=1 Tax=Candidatus Protochlamydia naegleriophila TaxID=389348 RepID=A0A0U5JCZ6_9BACT|nr:glycosyltransferase [Candidatus Protochlamydia naegleriophila]CUI15654.1 hypothetical protein PNK_0015 [Candidatus Protochlamydia naegleriophila]